MKTIYKITAIFCVLMIALAFTGCNDDGKDIQGTQNDEEVVMTEENDVQEDLDDNEAVDFSELVEFSYWLPSAPNDIESDYSLNTIVQYMNNKFNMKLVFQQPASGTETDSLNLMFGTGEYADIIDSSYYTGSIDQLYNDGVIIDIAEYLDYMPNLKKLLDDDPVFRKNVYNDYGQILKLPTYITEDPLHWGGLVYRRDILETMTGNNIIFPSGNDEPTTIEDWDYMLPLFKQYFEAADLPDYAPLIIPANGYFVTSELLTSFGTASSYYQVDGQILYGPIEDGFYDYLKKMNEWYKSGYVYKDFASRTNDLFYLPNTSLTYGGAAGVWFGLTGQLDDRLSLPEYGLNVDIKPLLNPINTNQGITSATNMMYAARNDQFGGALVSSKCENIERLMVFMDYMYSDEGSMIKEYGLTKDQGADQYELYQKYELTEGAYSLDSDGEFIYNDKLAVGSELIKDPFVDYKMPGMRDNKYTNMFLDESTKNATEVWLYYGHDKLPPLYRTEEEEGTYTSNQTQIEDYVNSLTLKFILGVEELNSESWNKYIEQIIEFGVSENIEIMQAAYDRYQKR